MPEYDFYCQTCRRNFILSMSLQGYEKKDFSCPQCKRKELKRVPSTFIAKTSRKS